MTVREAIKDLVMSACMNYFEDLSMFEYIEGAEIVSENMQKVEYFDDVPCVITDKDGNEWWIKVEKKRK